jgi:hypothetical protein
VHTAIDADGFQAAQIEFLRVLRGRLQDHLELRVHLHAVRVFRIPAIIGAVTRFRIGDTPGLGAEDAQDGRRVACACANLFAVRLPDQAALVGPVTL